MIEYWKKMRRVLFHSHVHGFLREIGQGVQHIASRVGNIIEFVQQANDRRKMFGEVRVVINPIDLQFCYAFDRSNFHAGLHISQYPTLLLWNSDERDAREWFAACRRSYCSSDKIAFSSLRRGDLLHMCVGGSTSRWLFSRARRNRRFNNADPQLESARQFPGRVWAKQSRHCKNNFAFSLREFAQPVTSEWWGSDVDFALLCLMLVVRIHHNIYFVVNQGSSFRRFVRCHREESNTRRCSGEWFARRERTRVCIPLTIDRLTDITLSGRRSSFPDLYVQHTSTEERRRITILWVYSTSMFELHWCRWLS